ncbi:MAG: murein hydrolase activator EnvC family protein [Mycobacterium leprae]
MPVAIARRRRRPLVALLLAAALLAGAVSPAIADDDTDELKAAQQKQQEIQAKKQQASSRLETMVLEKDDATVALQITEQELTNARAKLADLNNQVKKADDELGRLQTALNKAEQQYTERKTLLGKRLRVIQEEGRVSYLAVLLGSHSFNDFLNRAEVLQEIVQQDSRLMAQVRSERESLQAQRQVVSERKEKLVTLQAEQTRTIQLVQARTADQKERVAKLAVAQAQLQAQLAEYERQAKAVEDQIWQIQLRMNRKSDGFDPTPPLKGTLRITDSFGLRIHPIFGGESFHGGTDFAANAGEPIYAIEDGVVIHAAWDDVYGNRVVIDHGDGIASWYGHASKLLVSVGQTVKQGETIALVGSTGLSTGPHLHLEIRINNVRQDAMNWFKKWPNVKL